MPSTAVNRLSIQLADEAWLKFRAYASDRGVPVAQVMRDLIAPILNMTPGEVFYHEPRNSKPNAPRKKVKLKFTTDIAAKKTVIDRCKRGFSRQHISAITHLPYKQVDRICTEAGL